MKTFLLLIFLWCLTSCLGVSGPAGNPASGPEGGAVDTTLARPEAAQDAAQADSGKPHPGGGSAPANDWPGEVPVEWFVSGTVSLQCLVIQEYQRADGTTLTDQRVQTWVAGKVFRTASGEKVVLAGSNYYLLRITEGEGETLRCYDIVVDYLKDFSRTIAPADPSSLHYYVSKSIVNPMPNQHDQPCSPDVVAKDFWPLSIGDMVVAKAAADPLKECAVRARKTTAPSGDNPNDLGISVPPKGF